MPLDFNDAARQSTVTPAIRTRDMIDRILKELRQSGRVLELAQNLYGQNLIRQGRGYRIGNLEGDRGQSLSLAVEGESAGLWQEFNGSQGGTIVDMWMHRYGCKDVREAAQQIDESFLGNRPMPTAPALPASSSKPRSVRKEEVARYAYHDAQGEVLYYIVRLDHYDRETGAPILKDGKAVKDYMVLSPDGSWTYPPDLKTRVLYRLPSVNHTDEQIIFCEGEKAAEALANAGYESTCISGGVSAPFEKYDWRPLAGKRVLLWPDNDQAGFDFMERVSRHLIALGCDVRTLEVPDYMPAKGDAADLEDIVLHGLLKDPEPRKPTLPILSIEQLLDIPDPTWIVEGWIVDDGVSVFYGPPKTFKTFNVLDLALSVACGQSWRGQSVVQVPVLYVLGEGMGTFKHRVYTWMDKRSGGVEPKLHIVPQSVPVGDEGGPESVLEAIAAMAEKPQMIILDTLNRNFGVGDENSTQDMTRFVNGVDLIRRHTGAHICIVHHSGKDAEKGARGSSTLLGAVDAEFRITRTEGTRICTIECTANRHAAEPEKITVEMVHAETPNPRTGEILESLLPVVREANEGGDFEPKSVRMGKNEQRVLEYIQTWETATYTEIVNTVQIDRGSIGRALRNLEEKGLIEKLDGTPPIFRISSKTPPNATE